MQSVPAEGVGPDGVRPGPPLLPGVHNREHGEAEETDPAGAGAVHEEAEPAEAAEAVGGAADQEAQGAGVREAGLLQRHPAEEGREVQSRPPAPGVLDARPGAVRPHHQQAQGEGAGDDHQPQGGAHPEELLGPGNPEVRPGREKDHPPKTKYLCPATKDHEIKLKKLVKIHLYDGGNEEGKEFYCYACNKTLKFQKLNASRKCGHVMCQTCLQKVCIPEKQCMVCSKAFEKSDIISIKEGYSGFVFHNSVEATKFNPQMLV